MEAGWWMGWGGGGAKASSLVFFLCTAQSGVCSGCSLTVPNEAKRIQAQSVSVMEVPHHPEDANP